MYVCNDVEEINCSFWTMTGDEIIIKKKDAL